MRHADSLNLLDVDAVYRKYKKHCEIAMDIGVTAMAEAEGACVPDGWRFDVISFCYLPPNVVIFSGS